MKVACLLHGMVRSLSCFWAGLAYIAIGCFLNDTVCFCEIYVPFRARYCSSCVRFGSFLAWDSSFLTGNVAVRFEGEEACLRVCRP